MARSHGRLLTSIWSDDDWRDLSRDAQWCYSLLLSQPKLTLVGVLDLLPSRWARFSRDGSVPVIEDAIEELGVKRFVVVDFDTDELLIRTMVVHDVATSRLNVNLLKGFWSAWNAVASEPLRQVIVDHIPDVIWEHDSCDPDSDALDMRRWEPLEPMVQTYGSDQTSEPMERTPSHLSPVTCHPSPSPVASQHSTDNGSDFPVSIPATGDEISTGGGDGYTQTIQSACQLLTEMRVDEDKPNRDKPAYRKKTYESILSDHRDNGLTLLLSNPSLTPQQLAFKLNPGLAAVSATSPPDRTGAPERSLKPSENLSAARVARMALQAERRGRRGSATG